MHVLRGCRPVLRLFAGNSPLWAVLLPPVAFVAAALQLSLSSVDPDYWWHLSTGRWMLEHLRVPFTDPFSYTHGGEGWYAHEWLAELLIGALDRLAGYGGEIVATALIVATGAWLLGRAARYYGAGAREALLMVAGSSFFVLGNLAVRPQVFGWALLALLLHELAAHDNSRRGHLYFLPLLFGLWINVHLSALVGGAVLFIYAVHRGIRCLQSGRACVEERRRFLQVLGSGVLSALALCLNPRGPALLWFARVYANQHAVRYRYIGEWQRPAFSGHDRWLFAGAATAVLLTVAFMAIRRSLWPGVLVILFAAAALRAIRYGPLFGIVTVPAAGWVIGRFWGRRVAIAAIRVPLIALPAAGVAAVGAVVAGSVVGGAVQFSRHPYARAGGYPVDAAAWVKQNVPEGLVFNEYGWGGYLIAAFYPQRRVYIDGREEMYGERFFAAFVDTIGAGEGWQQTLAGAGVRAAIIDPYGPLASAMDANPRWRPGFRDTVAAVFVPVPLESGSSAP